MKQFAVLGLGRFGSSLARTLYGLGHDVLALDEREDAVQNISESVTHAVQADATDESTLRSLGLRNFDVVIISIGSDIQASILVTLIVKELGVKYVVAKAQSELHAKVLYKIGADRVVLPERDMGLRVAHNLVSSNILDFIELSSDYGIIEIVALDGWKGKTLKELNMRGKYGVNIIAIKRDGEINVSPGAEDRILENDVLVVIGDNDDIARLENKA
ncbi:MAG: TrkA family potassium uptake protein [Bacillota bacterium]|nr:TrkA family potassium uptake protein [Bacillota bacterium]MDD3299057.1 TrkA family potassium uptake protein [Bacillota bacterium]MDD3851921.1 TrkA family potassium uptake protein [Bacillota bacterium]MDD4708375.1 TrkA family potassium uptake protein [Bacillota bacterium]